MADPAPVAPTGSIMGLIALLMKLGGNLPAFMGFAQTVIAAWQTLQNTINAATGRVVKLMVATLTPAESAQIDSLHKMLTPHLLALPASPAGHPVAIFGNMQVFAGLFAFLKAHPALIQLLEALAQGMLAAA